MFILGILLGTLIGYWINDLIVDTKALKDDHLQDRPLNNERE